ncbi:hypothetical protein IGK74_002434 [Enterococcus sp. AZ150]|uniref:hypothetical protein n=1 Tax=Enterococcus sp. AZ150 TaxID=2774866 RepID=UPI003F290BFE
MIKAILFLSVIFLVLLILILFFGLWIAYKVNKSFSKEFSEMEKFNKEKREQFDSKFEERKREFENNRINNFFREKDK